MHIPVADLLIGDDHIPGMNLAAICDTTNGQREDPRPITVKRAPCGCHWEIRNGRHRYVTALILGHTHIHAEEES